MKFNIIALLAGLLLSPGLSAQIHLGKDIQQMKSLHPGKTFTSGRTSTGVVTYTADYDLGEFTYYIDSATGLCNFSMLTPKNAAARKTQIDFNNKKYTIVSSRLWKTRLEDGSTMTVNLVYDSDPRVSYFVFKNPK